MTIVSLDEMGFLITRPVQALGCCAIKLQIAGTSNQTISKDTSNPSFQVCVFLCKLVCMCMCTHTHVCMHVCLILILQVVFLPIGFKTVDRERRYDCLQI